ncbi:MAG TPA: hypothetical protein VEW42_05600 [Candidatus Eisenbacteria bacterium]|nr:hypothetical protein [Candidatus Eisenbacteria bacterium]
MSFILFAWIASIGYALVILGTKVTSKHSIKNPWLFNFLYNAGLLVTTIPIALFNHAGIPSHWEFIIATGFLYAASTMCFILSIYKLDVSTISPLFNFRIAFSVVLTALLIHEILPEWKYLLITVIFVFGLFTTIDERLHIKSFFQKPVAIALLGMIFTSLGAITTNRALLVDNYWTVSLWAPFFTVLFLGLLFPKFVQDGKKLVGNQVVTMLCIGLLDTIATFAANRAYRDNVAISSVIISLPISMFIAAAFSFFAPQLLEKHTVKVYIIRFVAAGLMIGAALKLSQ